MSSLEANGATRSTGAASSTVAEAFGATVSLSTPGRGLCLVVGRGDLESALAAARGVLVARIGSGRLLAVLTWDGLRSLWADPAVRVAGPVSLDPERFESFCTLIGAGHAPDL